MLYTEQTPWFDSHIHSQQCFMSETRMARQPEKGREKVMFSSSDVDHPCNGQSYDSSYRTLA